MEILLYDWWAMRAEQRVYDRLSRLAVQIVYTGTQRIDRDSIDAPATTSSHSGQAGDVGKDRLLETSKEVYA